MAATHLVIGMPWGRVFTGTGEEECVYEHLALRGAALGLLAVRDCVDVGKDAYTYPVCRVGDDYDDDLERTAPLTPESLVREIGGRAVVVSDGGHCQPRPRGNTPVTVSLVGFPAAVTPADVLAAAGVDPAGMPGGWAAWLGDPATTDYGDNDNDDDDNDNDTRVETLLRIWRAAASL